MTDNLPAVPESRPVIVARDTDSWAQMLPDVVELARAISQTDFVPESLRGSIGGTAAAILYGREVGLGPMTSLQNVHVIKGRPGLSAVIMRAQVFAAGHEIDVVESTSERCVMRGRRRGSDQWSKPIPYTMDDAKRAGLLEPRGKNRSPSPFLKMPRQMLRARATTELCELMFADVVRGMPSIEDLEAEAEAEDFTPPPPVQTTTKVQRKRTTKSGAAAGGVAAPDDGPGAVPPGDPGPSSPPLPPLPGEPGAETSGGAADPHPPQPAPPLPESDDGAGAPPATDPGPDAATGSPAPSSDQPKPASAAILRALHATFNQLGFTKEDREQRLNIARAISGEDIESSNDLTHEGARHISEVLARMDSRAEVIALMHEIAAAPADDQTGED
jgi:hypothetical protein